MASRRTAAAHRTERIGLHRSGRGVRNMHLYGDAHDDFITVGDTLTVSSTQMEATEYVMASRINT